MNTRKNPVFTFELFGSLGKCWIQRAGVVGYYFSTWELGAACDYYTDMEGNYWREDELEDFIAVFGTCSVGVLSVADMLPAIQVSGGKRQRNDKPENK